MDFLVFLVFVQDELFICMYICMLSSDFRVVFFFCFCSSFILFWFCLFMPAENKLYGKADTSTLKMTSLWDL